MVLPATPWQWGLWETPGRDSLWQGEGEVRSQRAEPRGKGWLRAHSGDGDRVQRGG